MFGDVTQMIESTIIVKGEDVLKKISEDEMRRGIAGIYIFTSKDVRDAAFESISKSKTSFRDVKPSVDALNTDLSQFGVENVVIVDAERVSDRVKPEELEKSIVFVIVFKSVFHKRTYLKVFEIAKRMGAI